MKCDATLDIDKSVLTISEFNILFITSSVSKRHGEGWVVLIKFTDIIKGNYLSIKIMDTSMTSDTCIL